MAAEHDEERNVLADPTELRVTLKLRRELAARAVQEFLAAFAEADKVVDGYLANEAKDDIDDLDQAKRALHDETGVAQDFAEDTAALLREKTSY